MASLGDPEKKICDNYQVLEEVAVSFVAQSSPFLHNGKVQGFSQILTRIVCKAESSLLATSKLS